MKIAYCSLLLPEEKKLAERSKERLSGISLHKFTRAIINGIDENMDTPVDVFNIINTLNYPKFPDLIFHTEKWSHTKYAKDWHIGYINLIGIKYITQSFNLFRKLDKWVLSNKGEKKIICVHHIYFPSMYAAYKIKKKYKSEVKICLITGDMNGQYGLVSQYKRNFKESLLKYVEHKIDKMAKSFDCFVFATKYMAKAFGVEDKPFSVVECAYLKPEYEVVKEEIVNSDEKIIFYAGALREEYGIVHLLRAFSLIEDKTYRLWLAGDGNAVGKIKEYSKGNSSIEYLGFLTPQEVERRQNQATVLISPRVASNYEYVKYSFPSKTMECLASGKPYIAHKLPCDPMEYENYILYADSESDLSLKEKIVSVCSLSREEQNEIGRKAKNFINKEKNPTSMTTNVVSMWNNLFEG